MYLDNTIHQCVFFFFNDTATTEIYTLSLPDALPISAAVRADRAHHQVALPRQPENHRRQDRKSTRLNSSHLVISYAVFCLKKKKRERVHDLGRANIAERSMKAGEDTYGLSLFFFFNDTATTEIYTLSLHDALPTSATGESPPP